MPGNFDKYDFLFALGAMMISIYVVGMINQRECTLTVTDISKRCDLPVDVQNFRIKDDVLLDAKDLADMENKWVTFRAKFIVKANRVSMEMVRLRSNKKITSEWRMDPQTATNGSQWFTLRGRWVGKPLSFEFDERFSMVSDDVKPVTRSEPWFNFKARTWLGKKVLKQIDLGAVPERTMPIQSAIHAPPAYIQFPKLKHNMMEKMAKATTISPDNCVKDDKSSEMSRQGAIEMQPEVEGIAPEDKPGMTREMRTEGTAIFQPVVARFQDETRYNISSDDLMCKVRPEGNATDDDANLKEEPTVSDDKATFTKKVYMPKGSPMPKCPRFPAYVSIKNTSVCLADELSMDECPLNASEAINDTASDSVNMELNKTYEEQRFGLGSEVADDDCPWYTPTQVLLGTAAVTTVTVTVATSYVMMARPQYFWASSRV